MSNKAKFGSKIGLIAATVGSAVGLGNVWRFPAVTQENGGAAFLLIYLGCVFILGIPVMLAEFSLGRSGGSDAVGVFRKLSPGTKWYLVGGIGVLASYFILSFYMVVAGWTAEYFWQSLTGGLFESAASATDSQAYTQKMTELITGSVNPLIWTYVMIAINLVILLKGVRKGIEKMSNILMPVLFVLLLVFCVVSLNLPNAIEGVKFFLSPDFSKVDGSTFVAALGQAFFSLSLGMGILITFAAYYPKETRLSRTAITVSLLDFLVAVLMGLIIFPAVKSFGLDNNPDAIKGVTLVFVTLPEVFAQMPLREVWSTLFFLLLAIAALTSTLSLGEVTISLLQDRLKLSRKAATWLTMLPLFLLSSVCSLSQGELSWLTIAGKNIFDFLDMAATNIMLPLSALFVCLYVGWKMPRRFLKDQLTNDASFKSYLYPPVLVSIRTIAPVLIFVILISYFLWQ